MTFPEPSSTRDVLGPGDTLGRYELLLPIAEGGMAVVWAARLKGSRGFSKTVAIKTMLPELSRDPHFEKMFLDEARIASRIRHPNVAEILDLGEQGGRLYLVMEWVDGEPLANLRRDALRQGGMPLGVAVKIVSAACAGLHAAHELEDEHTQQKLGIVHRDISPQNLLVTFDGMVKIVDFGVAKSAGRSVDKTSAGHVKGKPPYMSPEQASGLDVDRRTDVFALGIVLYQLVTGKHPFRGESDLVTLQNIISDKPVVAPRAHHRDCPKRLEQVILRAVQRDPEARFPTALAFEQALEETSLELPGTGQYDVARFVRSVAGERGARRRRQLQEANQAAEERSGAGDSPASRGERRAGTVLGSRGRISNSHRVTRSDEVTPVAVQSRSRSRLGLVLLGAAVASLFGLLLAFARVHEGELRARRLAAPSAPAANPVATRSSEVLPMEPKVDPVESGPVGFADTPPAEGSKQKPPPRPRAVRQRPRPPRAVNPAPAASPPVLTGVAASADDAAFEAAPPDDAATARGSAPEDVPIGDPAPADGTSEPKPAPSGFAPPPVENPGF